MPRMMIEYHDENERLVLEQAISFVRQMHQVAQTAPAGGVLAACEKVAVERGPAVLRQGLAAAVQSRLDRADQKGGGTPRDVRV